MEEKGTVKALVRSIVHVNIILHMEIKLTAGDVDHICKTAVSTGLTFQREFSKWDITDMIKGLETVLMRND